MSIPWRGHTPGAVGVEGTNHGSCQELKEHQRVAECNTVQWKKGRKRWREGGGGRVAQAHCEILLSVLT